MRAGMGGINHQKGVERSNQHQIFGCLTSKVGHKTNTNQPFNDDLK